MLWMMPAKSDGERGQANVHLTSSHQGSVPPPRATDSDINVEYWL